MVAEDAGGKLLDLSVAIDHARGGLRSETRDAGIAVAGIGHERDVVGDERRRDAELLAHAAIVSDPALAVDLHP